LKLDRASLKKVAGLILAAGKSERMGSPKPLLSINGTSFLAHIVAAVRKSKLSELRIVLGYEAEKVLKSMPDLASEVIVNPDYERGQLSSIIRAIQVLEASAIDGIMLFLVDHPFVNPELLDLLIQEFSQQEFPIVIPTFRGRRGHPMIFGRQLFPELVSAPCDQGAVAVVRSHQQEILHVSVQEEGVLIDIDTPEAYRQYVLARGMA
jgi:molybdenum cofactor cytidylyltransferase